MYTPNWQERTALRAAVDGRASATIRQRKATDRRTVGDRVKWAPNHVRPYQTRSPIALSPRHQTHKDLVFGQHLCPLISKIFHTMTVRLNFARGNCASMILQSIPQNISHLVLGCQLFPRSFVRGSSSRWEWVSLKCKSQIVLIVIPVTIPL